MEPSGAGVELVWSGVWSWYGAGVRARAEPSWCGERLLRLFIDLMESRLYLYVKYVY